MKREDIFVSTEVIYTKLLCLLIFAQLTSKLWNTHHKAEDVETQLDRSLEDLQTDYVDLYLVSQ